MPLDPADDAYPEHRLCNLRKNTLASPVDGRQQRAFGLMKTELTPDCTRCDWRFACHGGCPKHRIHRVGDAWHNHLCAGYKAMFAHMDPYMRVMAEQIRRGRAPAEVMQVASMLAAKESQAAQSRLFT